MAFTKVRSLSRFTAVCAGMVIFMSGCGDSTGPGRLDAISALRSLELGMGVVAGDLPIGAPDNGFFSAIGPLLNQVDVTIGGKSQTMFALGLRESFPPGTCMESIFIFPSIPPDNAVCTPMGPEIAVILWQSHSAFAPPDRLILLTGNPGTSDFSFATTLPTQADEIPVFAFYIEGQDNLWIAQSGTLTSNVAARSESCAVPLPSYAKAGSCSLADFDEEGAITFESLSETPGDTPLLNLTIPRQTFHGLWQVITETQQVAVPLAQRTSTR